MAGKLMSTITGFGDYKVNRNTVIAGNSVPSFRQGGDGVRVCHREFLFDVVGTVAFNLNAYFINPGLPGTFPWLSLIAQNFEEYEMDGLVFEYRPSSGSAVSSTSSALGVVILATDYDALNSNFASKQAMESYEYSTSTVPFTGAMHAVECARNKNVLENLYTRTTVVPSGADQRMYDMGKFQIATQGMQSSYTVGELWVSYDVRFRKPRLLNSPLMFYNHFHESPLGTATATLQWGTAGAVATPLSNLNTVFPSGSGATSVITFSAVGSYHIITIFQGSITGVPALITGGNITTGAPWYLDNAVSVFSIVTGGFAAYLASINVTAPGSGVANQVTFFPSLTGFTDGKIDMFVYPAQNSSLYLPPPSEIVDEKDFYKDFRPLVDPKFPVIKPSSASEVNKGQADRDLAGEFVNVPNPQGLYKLELLSSLARDVRR
jgi:hypothetical protein